MSQSRRWEAFLVGLFAAIALLTCAALAYSWGSFGWGLVLLVPLAVGFYIGYALPNDTLLVTMIGIVVVSTALGLVITFQLAGLLCGVIAGAVLVLPALLGAWTGHLLGRRGPKVGPYALLVFLPPIGLMYTEAELAPRYPLATIETARVVQMAPEEAWRRLVFFEDVTIKPPLFARIGLPHPLGTEGEIRGVGDIKVCRYNTGHLTKRITRYEADRYLEFEVLEQVGIEDRSAELVSGSFRFEPAADGGTRITLTTVYRPLLSARGVWRPFEESLARVLQNHVLDGIESAPPS